MLDFLAVGFGGFFGSIGRWLIGRGLGSIAPTLPFGTLVANIIAGLIIGFIAGFGIRFPVDERLKLFIAVGLCGGLSTFSTFSKETFGLFELGNPLGAILNIAANVVLCLLAVWAGLKVAALV